MGLQSIIKNICSRENNMNPDDLIQQQELQKEFNELVLSLSQQVSEKHLSEVDKNLNKLNKDISNKLEKHALLLADVGRTHPKSLEEVSKRYLSGVDKNLSKINNDIANKLDKHILILESFGKNHPKALEAVSEKYLSGLDKNLSQINDSISNKLERHSALLQQNSEKYPKLLETVSDRYTKRLEEVSANHISEVNKNLDKINEEIPYQLKQHNILLEEAKNTSYQQHIELSKEIEEGLNNIIDVNNKSLIVEVNNIMNQIDLKFKINNAELNDTKNTNAKLINELQRELDIKIEKIKNITMFSIFFIIIFVTMPIAFLIYFIIMR